MCTVVHGFVDRSKRGWQTSAPGCRLPRRRSSAAEQASPSRTVIWGGTRAQASATTSEMAPAALKAAPASMWRAGGAAVRRARRAPDLTQPARREGALARPQGVSSPQGSPVTAQAAMARPIAPSAFRRTDAAMLARRFSSTASAAMAAAVPLVGGERGQHHGVVRPAGRGQGRR
jgi:hypothetical protein